MPETGDSGSHLRGPLESWMHVYAMTWTAINPASREHSSSPSQACTKGGFRQPAVANTDGHKGMTKAPISPEGFVPGPARAFHTQRSRADLNPFARSGDTHPIGARTPQCKWPAGAGHFLLLGAPPVNPPLWPFEKLTDRLQVAPLDDVCQPYTRLGPESVPARI